MQINPELRGRTVASLETSAANVFSSQLKVKPCTQIRKILDAAEQTTAAALQKWDVVKKGRVASNGNLF